ncbi:TPA: phage tail protein, partial [Corynebacterium striatum]|nr:phage tail protein [Corynebacterium striatum]HAT1208505.1 phage tail protein [Corynebacterium striatum]
KAEATEGDPKVKAEIITGWYQSVYEPAATSPGK